MRANVNLDADAYNFAFAYASAKGIPLGSAISELLRRAEQSPESLATKSPRLRKNARGYFVKARTGQIVTSETVRESSEDDIV